MALQFVNPFSLLKAGTYIKNAKQYTALKKQLQKADDNPDTEIIGVSGFVFMERTIKASDLSTPVINGLTETVDSTSYPDRAIISLTNSLGYNAYITNFIIDGQPITRYKGAIVHDSLRRDDDIRRNGESLFELGNEYVIDATQATRLADYWYKNLGKKKHVYSVSIPGFAPWYSPGDWYTLSLGSAGTNEYISSTVECYDVQCSRTAGDIGSTTLMLREVEENWTKTTLYAARAVTGGSPKRRSQQSNTLIVAASTFDGTYDYKCDGTADDVEIQAAIDYVYYTFGGGEIILTEGTYKITSAINIYSNIALSGKGASASIIERDGDIYAISIVGAGAGTEMKDFSISWIGVINKTANTNTKPLYKLSYVKDFAIVESSAYGCQGTGIQIQFAVGGVIKDCIVTYCAAKDSGTGGYHGILIADSSGTLVSGCTASNNGNAAVATQGAGITVGVVSGASSGVKITGCTADNNIYAGIAIRDGAVCSVTGCYASGNTYNGIAFGASGSGVTNGTVTGCQAIGNGTQGIELFGSDNCSVSGCIASSGNIDGIVIYSGDSNIISGNNTEGNSGRGIYVASGNNNVITGNRATNNTTANFTDSGTATTDSGNDWT